MLGRVYISLILLSVILLFSECKKEAEVVPTATFEAKINNAEHLFSGSGASINKGVTIVAGEESKRDEKRMMLITIRGTNKGTYKQQFDYKTGVSVAECGLTYKIISKANYSKANYYISYEGTVNISQIDTSLRTISGTYNFIVKSVHDTNKYDVVDGNFQNLKYK